MKKLISLAACIMAVVMVAVSCTPKDKPDGKCELTAFSLSSSIAGTIDAAAKTITVVIPTSVTSNTFTPTFKVTDYDVVTIGGTPATSGETSVTIADGTKVVVADEVSAMSTEYTIKVVSTDQKAELVAVSFKAADNSLLSEDVTPDAIASEMVVRVPGEAFRQELTVTVEAGFNDVIKVNNETVASGSSIKVDTNFPIDITVTDSVDGATAKYVLKVGKILQYVVTELGTYAEGTMAKNDFTMTINPNDNLPYFAYLRKVGDESKTNMSIVKWNGSGFEMVGPSGFAGTAADAKRPKVAFAKDGSIYAFYSGGETANRPTVKKLDSDWMTIGTESITAQNYQATGFYMFPFFIHPANGQPMFFWHPNTTGQPNRRFMSIAFYAGDTWTTATISGVAPAVEGTKGAYYASSAVELNGKVYIASSFNQYGYFIHEVNADGSLTTIVDNFLPDGAEHGLANGLMLKVGPEGILYMFAPVHAGDGSMQIFTVDQSEGILKTYGAGLPVSIGASGGIDDDFGFGINPLDGLAVVAFDDSENTSIGYLDDNLQWAYFSGNFQTATSFFFVDFDKDGNGYISYQNEANAIVLYKVAKEEDILPE